MEESQLSIVARNIQGAARDVLPLKLNHIYESVAAGLGYRTFAAYKQAPEDDVVRRCALDVRAMRDRMRQLDERNALAFYGLLHGRSVRIEATRRPSQRGWPDTVIYDLKAAAVVRDGSGSAGQKVATDDDATFLLPMFLPLRTVEVDQSEWRKDAMTAEARGFYQPGAEPRYQVDSNHRFRIGDRPTDGLLDPEKSIRLARFRDGVWEGALFIHDPASQADADGVVRRVKAELARRMLEAIAPGVRCLIFAPEGYDFGAWQVLMRIGGSSSAWSDEKVRFKLPQFPHRNYKIENAYASAYPEIQGGGIGGGVFDKGFFHGHFYSSGCAEEANPTRLHAVKWRLIEAVEESLLGERDAAA